MKKGDKLFVRIDFRNNTKDFKSIDFENHIEYLKGVAKERTFLGGGFKKENGGMIIFEANNLEEAKIIANNDPLIKRELYTYKLYEWNLAIISGESKEN